MHITVTGEGPDLVLLHGWSMHSGVWHDFATLLAKRFTLHLVDLPGHGRSDWQPDGFELALLLEQFAEQLPKQALILGWSLGGLIGLAYAQRHVERVNGLCLLAATPCFVRREDWPTAMDKTVFEAFDQQLAKDPAVTLQQFLLLQARGSEQSRQTIKMLAAKMNEVGQAHPDALQAGLAMLSNLDLRAALGTISMPTQLLLGECDSLIPVEMAEQAITLQANLSVNIIDGAGHAPFISHPALCAELVIDFFEAIDD